MLSTALDTAQDQLFEEQKQVVEGFLAGTKGEPSGGDRYLINIHTEVDTLEVDVEGAKFEIEDRGHVPAETSRRMACDCSVVHCSCRSRPCRRYREHSSLLHSHRPPGVH